MFVFVLCLVCLLLSVFLKFIYSRCLYRVLHFIFLKRPADDLSKVLYPVAEIVSFL